MSILLLQISQIYSIQLIYSRNKNFQVNWSSGPSDISIYTYKQELSIFSLDSFGYTITRCICPAGQFWVYCYQMSLSCWSVLGILFQIPLPCWPVLGILLPDASVLLVSFGYTVTRCLCCCPAEAVLETQHYTFQ